MEHFSEDEIIAYTKQDFSPKQLLKIAKHLGECRRCSEIRFRHSPHHFDMLIDRVLNSPDDAAAAEMYPSYFNWRMPAAAFAGVGLLILLVFFAFQKTKIGSETEPTQLAQLETSGRGGDGESNEAPPKNSIIVNTPQNSDTAPEQPKTGSSANNLPQAKSLPKPEPKAEIARLGARGDPKTAPAPPRPANKLPKADPANNETNLRGCSQGTLLDLSLISPSVNAAFADNSDTITFSWKAVPGAVSYWLAVRDRKYNVIFDERELTKTSFSKSLPNGEYLWKVVPVFSSPSQTVNSSFTYFSVGVKNPKPPASLQSKKIRC